VRRFRFFVATAKVGCKGVATKANDDLENVYAYPNLDLAGTLNCWISDKATDRNYKIIAVLFMRPPRRWNKASGTSALKYK
jgi:hypothetical protein